MGPTDEVRRRQSIVDLQDGLLHRHLLHHSTRELEVVGCDDEDSLLGDVLLGEAILEE